MWKKFSRKLHKTEEVQPEQTQTEVQPEVAQTEEVQAEESQDEFQTGEIC